MDEFNDFFDIQQEAPKNPTPVPSTTPSPLATAELTMAKRGTKGNISSDKEGQLTLDVYQDKNEIIIRSAIAGVSVDNIDISVTTDSVTIKGTRQKEKSVKSSDYYFQELYWGAFSRKVILPEDIDPDKAKASMKNGILTIRLPKLAMAKSKKLSVK